MVKESGRFSYSTNLKLQDYTMFSERASDQHSEAVAR